jgi:hypothetical protein
VLRSTPSRSAMPQGRVNSSLTASCTVDAVDAEGAVTMSLTTCIVVAAKRRAPRSATHCGLWQDVVVAGRRRAACDRSRRPSERLRCSRTSEVPSTPFGGGMQPLSDTVHSRVEAHNLKLPPEDEEQTLPVCFGSGSLKRGC